MEAELLAMAECYPDEVKKTRVYRNRKKHLFRWDLRGLLELGRELLWIPSTLPVGKTARESGIASDDALARGDVLYFLDVVREIRNLVHPGRYLRRYPGRRITKRYFEFCYEMLQILEDRLYAMLESSIKKEMGLAC